MKKTVALLLSVIFALSVIYVPVAVFAADDSGSCGTNASYTYDSTNKILTISGTGATKDYGAGNTSLTRTPWHTYRGEIRKVIVQEGITSIGFYNFYNCTALTTVVLPSSLAKITSYSFYKASALSSINLGDTVMTTIGVNAFEDCTLLADVTLPQTMKTVSDFAFRNAGVKRINFPDSCTSIGQYAFYGCPIASVALPETIASVGMRSFANNTFLISVYIYNADLEFGGNDPFNGAQSSVTFYGHAGSTTEQYAADKGYGFVSLDSCEHKNTRINVLVSATCLTKGSQQIICNDCSQILRTEEVSALGHDMQVIQVDDQTDKNGHVFTYSRCARCQDTQFDTLTTTHAADANGDNIWVDGFYTDTVVTDASCTVPGVLRRKCTVDGCGKSQVIYTPAFGHTVSNWNVTKEATCTEDGSRSGVCETCSETVTETIKAGHQYECVVGNVDETGHRVDQYTCTVCGDSYEQTVHVDWIEGQYTTQVITNASCVMTGTSRDTCTVCGEKRNNVVPASGHVYKFTDCDGVECTYTCANCEKTSVLKLTLVESSYLTAAGNKSTALTYMCDINNDGYINIKDYYKIYRFMQGLDLPGTV